VGISDDMSRERALFRDGGIDQVCERRVEKATTAQVARQALTRQPGSQATRREALAWTLLIPGLRFPKLTASKERCGFM